jgi:hypothetical protein
LLHFRIPKLKFAHTPRRSSRCIVGSLECILYPLRNTVNCLPKCPPLQGRQPAGFADVFRKQSVSGASQLEPNFISERTDSVDKSVTLRPSCGRHPFQRVEKKASSAIRSCMLQAFLCCRWVAVVTSNSGESGLSVMVSPDVCHV